MDKKLKTKYIATLLALIPGCGHFYLGFYKRGAYVSGIFFGSFVLAILIMIWTDYPYLNDAFGFCLAVVYFWAINDAFRALKYHFRSLEN